MKANELTDGIYVYFNCFDGSKIIVKVTGFKDNIVYGVSEYGAHWCPISKTEPIPLTLEILEKNGFRQIGEKFIWGEIDDELIEIIPSINNSYRIKVSVADLMISCNIWCSHVHQLQYALKLCEIEKELIL